MNVPARPPEGHRSSHGEDVGQRQEGSRQRAPVIELRDIHKRFEQRPDLAQRLLALTGRHVDRAVVHAVNGVNLTIAAGEVRRPGGRVGLRQIDAGPRGRGPARAQPGRAALQRPAGQLNCADASGWRMCWAYRWCSRTRRRR